MRQYRSKVVLLTERAKEDYFELSLVVREKFLAILKELAKYGELDYPTGRKLSPYDLYEIRVKLDGIYRAIYCYVDNQVVVLSFFRKKSQKTPLKEIRKALKRRNNL